VGGHGAGTTTTGAAGGGASPVTTWSVELEEDRSVSGIAVGSDGLFVVGSFGAGGSTQGYVEKRDLDTGERIASFGDAGVVAVGESARAAALDDGAVLFTVKPVESSGDPYVYKLSAADGSDLWPAGAEILGESASSIVVGGGTVYDVIVEPVNDYIIEKRALDDGHILDSYDVGVEVPAWIGADASGVYEVGWRLASVTQPVTSHVEWLKRDHSGTVVFDGERAVNETAMSGALDDGHFFIVGRDESISSRWLALGKGIGSGSTTFQLASQDAPNGTARVVAADGVSVYIGGSASNEERLEKRGQADEALDAAFGAGGVLTLSRLTSDLEVHGGALYLVSRDATTSRYHLEKRSAVTGAL
jgi:hypothetical protein